MGGAGAGDFVRRQPEAAEVGGGPIVDEAGHELGHHDGVTGYTIGQRKGLGVAAKTRLHVLAIDADTRSLVVGPPERLDKRGLVASRASWPGGAPSGPVSAQVKIRYRDRGASARVEPLGSDRVRVWFERPVRAIAPGQAAVFYRGDEVIGGAWIDEAIE